LIPAGVLHSGSNSIDLITPAIDGVDTQVAFMHSLCADYTRTLDASAPLTVTNTGKTTKLYEASNLSAAGAWVVDVRYPDRAGLVSTEMHAQNNGTYKLRFNAATGGTGQYLIV